MKTVMDSVNEITPELFLEGRHRRAVAGQAAETAASAVRRRHLVLRLSGFREGATPVPRGRPERARVRAVSESGAT